MHAPDPEDPLGVLAAVGGLEHAAIVGMILTGAVYGVPVVLDGVVSNSAALVAGALAPHSAGYLIAGHRLRRAGGSGSSWNIWNWNRYSTWSMRLGEGTGGLLAVPLVQAAARTLAEMATLEELGTRVSGLSREAIEGLHSPLARVVEVHEALGSTQMRARELARAGTPTEHSSWPGSRLGGGDGSGATGDRPRAGSGCLSCCGRSSMRASPPVLPRPRPSGWRGRSGRPGSRPASSGPTTCSQTGRRSAASSPNRARENAGGPAKRRDASTTLSSGVGMNANLDPADLGCPDREITTIRSELGRDVDLLDLLRALLSNLEVELGGSRTSGQSSKSGET